MYEFLRQAYPEISDDQLHTAMRLSDHMAYSAIEMLIEDPSLDEDLTAEENMEMHGRLYKIPKKEQDKFYRIDK